MSVSFWCLLLGLNSTLIGFVLFMIFRRDASILAGYFETVVSSLLMFCGVSCSGFAVHGIITDGTYLLNRAFGDSFQIAITFLFLCALIAGVLFRCSAIVRVRAAAISILLSVFVIVISSITLIVSAFM